MSFAEQERVLFDLLFDPAIRRRFIDNAESLLDQYQLEDSERADFKTIRPEALTLDAKMRTGLLLSTISNSYPLSFSLISSLNGGVDLLRQLIDTETMHAPPLERFTVFGTRLRDQLAGLTFDKEHERPLVRAIIEAELGMTYTAANLKQYLIAHGEPIANKEIADDWANQPVKIAEFVSVSMLPQAYVQLKRQLCPKAGYDLWTQLTKKPLAAARKTKVLQQYDPHLLIARAVLIHASHCEPAVEHQTLELSEGFAHLFPHIDGNKSVEQLLAAFKQAGAPESLLVSVKKGFSELIHAGMLRINNE